jgi:homocysteine S-methyltransferase
MTPMSPASRYRAALPQLGDELFLTDGGLETTLIFHRGIDLPEFSAFDLLKDEEGIEELRRYFISYLELAKEHDAGFILESPTWRASPRWGEAIGYSADELDEANRKAIALMAELRDRYEGDVSPIVISGNIGPQDDGYDPKQKLSADQAADYHSTQIGTFADTESDMVTALTLTYVDEAIGIARAAADAGIPAATERPTPVPGDRGDGRRDRRRTRLLHDQLRTPHPLRFDPRRVVDDPDPGHSGERLHEEPRRARRGDGPGRR